MLRFAGTGNTFFRWTRACIVQLQGCKNHEKNIRSDAGGLGKYFLAGACLAGCNIGALDLKRASPVLV